MRSDNEVDVVLLAELLDDVFAEYERNTPFVFSPAGYVVRVSPKQVAQDALVRNVLRSRNPIDQAQVRVLKVGREPSVHAEDALVDDRRDGQVVEH